MWIHYYLPAYGDPQVSSSMKRPCPVENPDLEEFKELLLPDQCPMPIVAVEPQAKPVRDDANYDSDTLFFSYKNHVYKHVEAQITLKIKNVVVIIS